MLLDMFYIKYFDERKIIYWHDIKQELESGENKEDYARIFFDSPRTSYTETEWINVEKRFNKTVNSFDDLGWVKKLSGQQEELAFEIKAAIHRMAKLYEKELSNFTEFALQITAKEEEE